jgi:HK97 family phage portal protein
MKLMRAITSAARAAKAEIWSPSGGLSGVGLRSSVHASPAGQTVTATTAMKISAAFDCTRKTSQVVAGLPLHQFQKERSGSRARIEDDLSDILTISPNSEQTAFEFIEGLISQLCLQGNAYAEKLFIGSRLVGLRPLFGVKPRRVSSGALVYDFLDRGKRVTLPAERVVHVRGFGSGDGVGLSPIQFGARSMGAALAADEMAGAVLGNGMHLSGFIQTDGELSSDQRDQLEELLATYSGSSKAGKVMALEAGLKWQSAQMSPEDAQLLDTRRFGVEDVCRWFGVPPVVVGHAGQGQTMWGSGVEAIMLSWLTLGVNPLLTRIESRIQKDLIPLGQRRTRSFEFKREAMIQMDSEAKGNLLTKLRFSGVMSGDEGRDVMNLPRRGGAADELVVQSSMVPVSVLGKDEK